MKDREQRSDAPLVSVIMAAYNCERYVGEAIESVQRQTYQNWELLVVDDASTDGTRDVVAKYCEKDSRIRLLSNEENLGPAGARNVAIAAAHGELIAVLDADDVSFPDRLARSVAVLKENPDLDLLASRAIAIGDNGQRKGLWPWGKVHHSSVIMRSDALRQVGGYEEFFAPAEDTDLLHRFALRYNLGYVDPPLSMARVHDHNISLEKAHKQLVLGRLAHIRRQALERGQDIDLAGEYERLARDRHVQASCHYDEGRGMVSRGMMREARMSFARAIELQPQHLRARVRWLITLLPQSIARGIGWIWALAPRAQWASKEPLDWKHIGSSQQPRP